MIHVRSMRDIYSGIPCDFIGNKCNNAGLNKVITDNILTGKRNLDFSLKLL